MFFHTIVTKVCIRPVLDKPYTYSDNKVTFQPTNQEKIDIFPDLVHVSAHSFTQVVKEMARIDYIKLVKTNMQ